jgi:hypothetical protein
VTFSIYSFFLSSLERTMSKNLYTTVKFWSLYFHWSLIPPNLINSSTNMLISLHVGQERLFIDRVPASFMQHLYR